MKRILILLILISNLTFGQEVEKYEENLNRDFIEYNDLILKQEFDKSMDYMLPEFFEIIPRNQMVLLMKQVYNNPDLEFKMDKPKDIDYGKPEKIEEKYYSEITYSYDIKMKFNNVEKTEDEEQNELNKNLTKLTLEKTFGSGNVIFNEETEFYEIHSVKNAFGISENGTSDWKFVVVEPKQKFILEKILPKELTEKL
jgi:predicted RND superfamily exporter protein